MTVRNNLLILIFIVISSFSRLSVLPAHADQSYHSGLPGNLAFWVWTPETNKWVNPKYAIKDTPQEQLQFGMDFYNAKQYKEAIREFQKLIEHYPRAREAPDAQYHIGLCLEEQDNILGAFK